MSESQHRPFPLSGLALERDRSEVFDLTRLLMIARRRARLFVLVALPLAALVAVCAFLMPRTYSATAEMSVSTERPNVISAQQEVVTQDQPTTFAVDTQVEALKSRDLARRVVEQLHLDRDKEFVPPGKTKALSSPVEAATDVLTKNLKIGRAGVAFAIDVTYNSQNPVTAAMVANSLVLQHQEDELKQDRLATEEATRWLGGRISDLQNQVISAETAVQRYRAENGLLNTAENQISTQQELERLTADLTTAQADLAEKRAAGAAARTQATSPMAGQDVHQVLNSVVIGQLRQQRAGASARLAELETRYGESYPATIEARSQLSDIDQEIRSEIDRNVSSLQADARVSAGRVAALQSSFDRAQRQLAQNGAASVRLNELERNAEAVRTLYEGYLARFRQTSTQQGLATSGVRILSRAVPPTRPSAPKLAIFMVLALTAGIAGGAGAVVLSELLDRNLRTPDAIMAETGLRTLASVPSYGTAFGRGAPPGSPLQLVLDHPLSPYTESLRMLLGLFQSSVGDSGRVIAITSALPDEGKSALAASLSQVAAMAGPDVLLVECDARRRSGAQGSRHPAQGLLEVLEHKTPLDAALISDDRSGLTILPLSRNVPKPADALDLAAFEALLANLRKRFRLIILDTGPVMAIAETRSLAAKADAVCFVVRWGRTPINAAVTSVELLKEVGANVSGAVLSHVNLRRQRDWSRNDPSAYYQEMRRYYS